MNYAEISKTLRNPNGPYFAEGTPSMVALEAMVDTVGLNNVLYALAHISSAKANHCETNWQDRNLSRTWDKRARKLTTWAGTNLLKDI
jgi:hypothetical protein